MPTASGRSHLYAIAKCDRPARCAPKSRGGCRRKALSCVAAALWSACLLGCNGEWQMGSGQPLFAGPFRTADGADWTIMCMEWRGPDRRSLCEQAAKALQQTSGVDSRKVFTEHAGEKSRLYYGRYFRSGNKRTGKFNKPRQMLRDVALIKDLTVDGSPFFIESRLMPYPTPDVGKPEWRLRNNPGVYTLRIAVFYPEPGFGEYKEVAADYCAELRNRGYEAYYRHGDFTSEVFVGSFSTRALLEVRKAGVLVSVPGEEVVRLQKNELFRFELHNGKTLTSSDEGQRLARASRVVPVRDDSFDDEFDF